MNTRTPLALSVAAVILLSSASLALAQENAPMQPGRSMKVWGTGHTEVQVQVGQRPVGMQEGAPRPGMQARPEIQGVDVMYGSEEGGDVTYTVNRRIIGPMASSAPGMMVRPVKREDGMMGPMATSTPGMMPVRPVRGPGMMGSSTDKMMRPPMGGDMREGSSTPMRPLFLIKLREASSTDMRGQGEARPNFMTFRDQSSSDATVQFKQLMQPNPELVNFLSRIFMQFQAKQQGAVQGAPEVNVETNASVGL